MCAHTRKRGAVLGDMFDDVFAAARRGDEHAWYTLYHDLAGQLTGYLAGSGALSPEDVASDTLLQVVRDLHRFTGDEPAFRSWVFTIAHHRLIDQRRKDLVRPSDATERETLERHCPTDTIEQELNERFALDTVMPLLSLCTDAQRDVLLLRYIGDVTLHDVAEIIGKDYNTVKALHRRGLDSLRSKLFAYAYPNDSLRTLS